MTVRRRVVAIAALGLVLAACGPATPVEVAATADTLVDGVLTVCVSPTPGIADPAGGGFEGTDVEVLEDVTARLELELRFVETQYDDIVTGVALQADRCDLGAGGIVLGGDLDTLVDVTASYGEVERVVVAPAPGADVETAVVGYETEGPADDAVENLTAGEIVGLPSGPDLVRAFTAGQVDAVLIAADDVADVEEAAGPVTEIARVPTGDRTVFVLPRATDEAFAQAIDEAIRTVTGTTS